MSGAPRHEVTRLLLAWNAGDQAALEELAAAVEAELRRLARGFMRHERAGHTLQTTALVNEAFLRLVDQRRIEWRNRAHFFAIAARMMRRVLVDHARRRLRQRRGGDVMTIALDVVGDATAASSWSDPADVLAVNDALTRLEALDARQSEIVELRVFGGLSNPQIGEVTGVSERTVKREWSVAKLWLHRELTAR
jgi:RNA polymerase sigma factor (TIGR02999 family)